MSFKPSMDPEGLAFFTQQVAKARCYLEFGCGGSTYHAATEAKVPQIFSIDTDGAWVAKIREALAGLGTELHLDHCNLGEVGDWGTPVNADRYLDFHKYPTIPWRKAAERGAVPEFVLIDGRFRVACFLYTLLCARVGTTVMFDDYLDRPYYFMVENFCPLSDTAGRAGIFTVTKAFDPRLLAAEFARTSLVWS